MNSNKEKYIFILNNLLESYSEIFTINDNSTFFWIGSLEQFHFILEKVEKTISREKILLVVNKEFIDNSLNEIIKIFSSLFKFFFFPFTTLHTHSSWNKIS